MAQEEQTRTFQTKLKNHFYKRFQIEYHTFYQALEGISSEDEQHTYTTLLLRRLMVLYFLQSQGLLARDPSYLSNQLRSLQKEQGRNYFYRSYLLPLFQHVGSSPGTHPEESISPSFARATIPATALPLFQIHPIELHTPHIQIADDAFLRLFAFFDTYQWNIQEQKATQNELSPEILGNIFEQQINQRQTGSYYTKNDVTLYIARSTILPYLLHIMKTHFPQEFAPSSALWQLLQKLPERYIQASLRSEHALPKETLQEYTVRRARYQQLHAQLKAGQIHHIGDLVTYNLTIPLLMQDWLASCNRTDLLLNFYRALKHTRILDPTCGSGAFLYAATHTLEPLYVGCFERMEALVHKKSTHKNRDADEEYLERCSDILKKVQEYPTRRLFILTTIINHNLYGVDIMEEAIDLCKLRLFLTLASCCERIEDMPLFSTLHWNIVAGDALAGSIQNQGVPANKSVNQDNTCYLADTSLDAVHRFSPLIAQKRFDIILGNPPYIEYSKIRQQHITTEHKSLNYGNLYAAIFARSLELCHPGSYLGIVVPLSVCSSERFGQLRHTMIERLEHIWLANFEIFPSRLFDGAFQRLSIVIGHYGIEGQPEENKGVYTTKIQRWYAIERPHLIDLIGYVRSRQIVKPTMFPKLASPLQETILHKLVAKAAGNTIASALSPHKTDFFVYYQEATNYWMKATCRIPFYKKNGRVMEPAHGRFLYFREPRMAHVVMALMNSSLFYLWFATYSDGFHLSHTLVKDFPLWPGLCGQPALEALSLQLEAHIQKHAKMSTRNTKVHTIELEEFRMHASKGLLDEIDRQLGRLYGLSEEEVEFVLGYDIKYRMGKDNGEYGY